MQSLSYVLARLSRTNTAVPKTVRLAAEMPKAFSETRLALEWHRAVRLLPVKMIVNSDETDFFRSNLKNKMKGNVLMNSTLTAHMMKLPIHFINLCKFSGCNTNSPGCGRISYPSEESLRQSHQTSWQTRGSFDGVSCHRAY